MTLRWRRAAPGEYESSAQYWDAEAGKHKPVYTIKKSGQAFVLYVKENIYVIERQFSKLLGKEIETTRFATLGHAKKTAQMLENESPTYQTKEERGFAEGGGWSGAACITSDGRGIKWHTDKNGCIVED